MRYHIIVFITWAYSLTNSVLVIGFPCKFRSMRGVSVKSVDGRGWGSLLFLFFDIWLFLRDSVFSFVSIPISNGNETRVLLSKLISVSVPFKWKISAGMDMIRLNDKSNFSNFIPTLYKQDGTLDSMLCDMFTCFNDFGILEQSSMDIIIIGFAGDLLLCLDFLGTSEGSWPSRFPFIDKFCNLDNWEITLNESADSWFSSHLNDFKFTKDALSWTGNVCNLFRETSKVLTFVKLYIKKSDMKILCKYGMSQFIRRTKWYSWWTSWNS